MEDELPPNKHITTLHTYKTDYSADSVEWCPHEPHQNVFVCANYQLLESSTDQCNRTGRILLFSVTETDLTLHQTLDTAAVLDQKWCHNLVNSSPLLGVVNAKKTLEIYTLETGVKLVKIAECNVDEEDSETLLLSLDWNTGKYETTSPDIVCSDSKGRVHVFTLSGDKLELKSSYKGHGFEAWITCFDYWNPHIFFSGGDDCKFLKFDQRTGTSPVSVNSKTHEAGVTAMHSNAKREHVLATGSYDTVVRLWDQRHFKQPLDFVKTPGTLWRLKFDPFEHNHLLAACMLGGVHIIDTTTVSIYDSYYEHKNIAYGADWCFAPANPCALLASCSFYDRLLCVSEIKLP